ncbi:periplasmic heavy metal sensor [Caulobacter vibrioides]|uniref:periplasmic heavy metal sensor n=1 Tax=Caulobacter vibrioides TaxID=155892 RepID=UPI000BB46D97|nr:periplasmic heavy metal sensor [Caulobacter vibrioides]ATC25660.1 hypothetical protein CA608_14550 [Caulobacter vibrioides]AZH13815.1 periplasmic heavy metal sensor [Caulobacter vibrioides]PLR07710.1 hypothetical protein CVUC_19365 [Caulobacter vibrioides]
MSLPRPLLIGLIASGALNVFLIGGVAGVTYVRLSTPPASVVASTSPMPSAAPAMTTPAERQPDPALAAAPVRQAVERAARPVAPQAQSPGSVDRPARPPLWTAGEALSPENRRGLRQALRAANQKNMPITQRARAERRAALAALASPGFDAAEVSRRLATARDLEIQARGNVETALATFAATLSPQERAALAQGLSEVYAPRQPRRGEE